MKSYLRVSEILGRLQDFSKIDPEVLAEKCRIGTNVHESILQDSLGDFPLLETERAAAYFGSYAIFKAKEKPTYKMQVPRLYDDELMITGEIDGLVEGSLNVPYIIDWKCSANANEEIWEMQAHFYWYLLKSNNIEIAPNMKWVNLRVRKTWEEGKCGEKIARYHAAKPKVHDFMFNENVLSRCIDEANRAWEEKRNSLVLDF